MSVQRLQNRAAGAALHGVDGSQWNLNLRVSEELVGQRNATGSRKQKTHLVGIRSIEGILAPCHHIPSV